MATHSNVLAWRIPGTGEPGGVPSMGLHRVGHDWSDLAAVAAAEERLCGVLAACVCFWEDLQVKYPVRFMSEPLASVCKVLNRNASSFWVPKPGCCEFHTFFMILASSSYLSMPILSVMSWDRNGPLEPCPAQLGKLLLLLLSHFSRFRLCATP